VIVNGSSNRCVWWWAQHLQSEENDNVRIVKTYGLRSSDIYDMLKEMMDLARGTKCENAFYQMNLNPGPSEHLTEKDWERAREIAEKHHGLEGQPYFMVMHTKYGREHPHFIYSRIDLQNMRAISDSNDARKNHAIAREIEREFGLQKVIGPYDLEAGMPRPPRAPKKYEMYRDKQHGLDTRDIQAEVTELFQQSRNGPEFKAALEQNGYELVTGRRGLLILDSAGNEHSLARRCGITMKEINAFMRDVDREALVTVEQGRAQYLDRKIAGLEADRATVRDEIQWEEALAKAAIAKEQKEQRFIAPEDREKETRAGRDQAEAGGREKVWPINPPQPDRKHWTEFGKAAAETARDDRMENLTGPAAKVREAWQHSDSAQAYAAALDEKGISFARVTKEEADRSHREEEFAKTVSNRGQRFKEGEIVIVTEARPEYRRNGEITEPRSRVYKLDQSLAYKFVKGLDSIDKLQGIDATRQASDKRAQQRAADWQAIRLERATDIRRGGRTRAGGIKDNLAKSPAAILKPVAMGVNVIAKPLQILENLFEGLFAPKLTPEQIRDGEIAARERQADGRDQLDQSNAIAQRAQERQQEEQQEAARQREERERYGGGRER
jgi:hypothetical protein